MKPKHNGIAILIIFAVTGIGMLTYSILLANQTIGSIRITRPTTAKDIKVPDKATMAYINFLLPQLPVLAATHDNQMQTKLNLFGYSPEKAKKTQAANPSQPQDPANLQYGNINAFSYNLTLSFTSKNKNFCMIDGILYTENNTLPDGGKILKIETGRVYVKKNQTKQWIYSQDQ